MKIINHIGIIFLGGALLASCQQEYPDNPTYVGEGIVFTSPYSSRSIVHTTWEAGNQIGVMGYCGGENSGQSIHADLWDNKKGFVTPDIFYNEPLTYGGDGNWTYNWNSQGLHPWEEEEDSRYTFIAYSPYTTIGSWDNVGTIEGGKGDITLSGENDKGEPTFTFTMPHNGWSEGSILTSDVADLMMAVRKDHTKADGIVSLNFEHMLTAMEFEINNYNLDKTVTINKIEVRGRNFHKELTIKGIDIENASIETEKYSGTFAVLSNPITLEKAEGNIETGEITPTTQKITGSDGKTPLDLLFIVDDSHHIFSEDGDCSVIVTPSNGEPRSLSLKDGNVTFTRGIKNIFSINYVGNDFLLQVRAEDNWEAGGDDNIYFD